MTMVERAAEAVAAARAAFADAAALARASHQDVVDLLALTAELSRVVDAQRVRLAGAVAERSSVADEQSICRLLGSRHARDAVASAFGVRAREAAELLSMAAATTSSVGISGETIATPFPRVADALDTGSVSLAQARAIVGTLAPAAPRADLGQLAWAEGCLVAEASHPEHRLAPELLVTQAQAYVAVLDPDGVLPDSERQRAARSFRMWQRADGMWRFDGSSPAEAGSALKALLDAYTSPRIGVAFRDGGSGPGDEQTGGMHAEGIDAGVVPVDDRTPAQKRHDVLIALVEAHAASGDAPIAGGEVPRLVFTGTIEAFDAYARGVEHADRVLTIEHTGAVVPIETADRLLCEAVVQRAVVDAAGQVLELGREQRTFNRVQRRALAMQYGGCATPGCGMPVAWTEGHHVVWWQHGGPTDVANGILLCSHCHHEVHAGRLLVVGSPGDWRVVPQLRPADPYARATRSPAPADVQSAARTMAAAAEAPLAVRLPDPIAVSKPPVRSDPSDANPTALPATRRRDRTHPGAGRRRCRGSSVDLMLGARYVVLRM